MHSCRYLDMQLSDHIMIDKLTILTPANRIRFIFASLIVVVLAYMFWTGSRYPALDEKAMMSGSIQLEDSLSFEAKFPLSDDMSLPERVFWSTLNWINTNKKGMIFGVLFAAAFLTAASYLQKRSFKGAFPNALLGMVIGTPLGVCVNCAAPIAKGMYSAGLRAETTLSAMIASPTLNPVVLTMLFSLLPSYMVILKIALSLVTILIVVPLICRALPIREISPNVPAPVLCPMPGGGGNAAQTEPVAQAVLAVLTAYLKNLWYIVKLTVPLMLLAGFLGALVATLLPQDIILTLPFTLLVMAGIALVGVFLPVPIAFDVVITATLLGLGLNHGYVMVLLFTLGTFSVYSYFIVATSVGPRAAWMLAASVALLGMLGGGMAEGYHRWQSERALEILLQGNLQPHPAPSLSLLWGAAYAAGTEGFAVTSEDAEQITVKVTPLALPSPATDTLFTRTEASVVGIDKPIEFSFRDMWPPFWEGRSLSTGDIDRDGDLDLVIASTEKGLYFYSNDGKGQFSPTGSAGPFADMHVFNAALVDMDNDGWLDLVIATYLDGLWLLRNDGGTFDTEAAQLLPNREDAPLAMALSFADADSNGYLDIAVGNWSAGWYRRIPGEESRNRIIWNDGPEALDGQFRAMDLVGIPGETLSILWSDINDDTFSDLIVGNDFDIPDYVYLGDGAGALAMVPYDSGLIPHTTTTTMAVKTGHLTGKTRPDIYFAQISGRSSGVSTTLKMRDLTLYCNDIENLEARATCEENMAIKDWYKSGNSFDPTYASKCHELAGRNRDECRAMLVKDLAIQKRDPNLCELIPKGQDIPKAYCRLHFEPVRQPTTAEIALTHPQILRSNVLLEWANSAYIDHAEQRGIDVGGWSWDTKLADFDLDGDLDVYIVNGTWVPNEVSPSNLYFENDGNGNFTEGSGPNGLEDYLMTASVTAFDSDGDGDLDLVTHPVNGPLVTFINGAQNPRLTFRLTDMRANSDAIGAVITLMLPQGQTQIRELQLGGGFMSFDALSTSFGLGPFTQADGAVIRWSDGTITQISGPLVAGAGYHVTHR